MVFKESNPKLASALAQMGITEPTDIQKSAIPEIRKGKDVVGQSTTGSGKTIAFGLPILEKLRPGIPVQALILTPTRELCVQVADTLKGLGRHIGINTTAVFGGVSIEPQMDAIRRSEIVVATPGRMLDHMDRRTINFQNTKYFILDEADKMFEMGFVEDVEQIMKHIPNGRQTLLFSATMTTAVMSLVKRHLQDPVIVKAALYIDRSLLKQRYYSIEMNEKFSLLVHLLKHATGGLAIVFCATRHVADSVAKNLQAQNVDATAIHGGLAQNRRLKALNSLKAGKLDVLVATDVAARGIDVKNISHIYNYDVPKNSEDYIHRIGRTARAGEGGDAVTLLTERDHDNFRNVLSDRSLDIVKADVPPFERVRFQRTERTFDDRGGNRGHGRPQSRGGRYSGEDRSPASAGPSRAERRAKSGDWASSSSTYVQRGRSQVQRR